MATDGPTRRPSKPMLIVGGCVASLVWLIPIVCSFVWDIGPLVEMIAWIVVWPLIYVGTVAFSFVASRALDLKTTARAFGYPEGPAPRWAHLVVQLITFVGLPSTILGHMVTGIVEKLGG